MTTTGSSSTGLEPNLAAALAYLAGPVSGATILLAEQRSSYVRFHAWQAIIGLGGLGVAALALLASAFLALLVSPVAFRVLYVAAAGVAVVWIIVWLVCLFQAFTGREWKMPLVGGYAARRSVVSR